jgi:glycosyltransferase involved in cell wall biosynthesis
MLLIWQAAALEDEEKLDRKFSIITTCKGRLDHLKLTLPRMIQQKAGEVIVVDYSCPQGTGDYVEKHFPLVRVVRVEGESGFSNWRARNRGAEVANSDVLVFCDADTILADEALKVISATLPPRRYGFFSRKATLRFNKSGIRIGDNQLRGFHVVPTQAFRALGGYDEVLEGYAAGGDTDLEDRLVLRGIRPFQLGDGIIDDVIEHEHETRFTYHRDPISISYAAGILYRRAKLALLRTMKQPNLDLKMRRNLYAVARKAASGIPAGKNVATMNVTFENQPVGMPRQLGYSRGMQSVSLTVRIALEGKLPGPPTKSKD